LIQPMPNVKVQNSNEIQISNFPNQKLFDIKPLVIHLAFDI